MIRGIGVGVAAVLLGILLALVIARVADASLGDRYPPDEDGVIHDPQIDAFASLIVGWPYAVACIPDPDDGADARTDFWQEQQPDGSWLILPPPQMSANGAICGALDHLLNYQPGFFHRYELVVVGVTPVPLEKPRARGGRSHLVNPANGREHASRQMRVLAGGVVQIPHQNDCSWKTTTFARCLKPAPGDTIWGSNRVERAAGALFVVTHDAWHARLFGQSPRVDDGHLAAFDEGVTECFAVRDLPRVIGSLHLPDWLSVAVLDAARSRHAESTAPYLTVC